MFKFFLLFIGLLPLQVAAEQISINGLTDSETNQLFKQLIQYRYVSQDSQGLSATKNALEALLTIMEQKIRELPSYTGLFTADCSIFFNDKVEQVICNVNPANSRTLIASAEFLPTNQLSELYRFQITQSSILLSNMFADWTNGKMQEFMSNLYFRQATCTESMSFSENPTQTELLQSVTTSLSTTLKVLLPTKTSARTSSKSLLETLTPMLSQRKTETLSTSSTQSLTLSRELIPSSTFSGSFIKTETLTATKKLRRTPSLSASSTQNLTLSHKPILPLTHTRSLSNSLRKSLTSTVTMGLSQSSINAWPVGNCSFYYLYLADNRANQMLMTIDSSQGMPCTTKTDSFFDCSCETSLLFLGGTIWMGSNLSDILPALQQMTELKTLWIPNLCENDGVQFSETIKHLSKMQNLKIEGRYYPEVPGNSCTLGNKGAIAITKITLFLNDLRKLSFYNNNITDRGAAEIAEIIKSINYLNLINLGANNLTDAGAIAILEAVKSSSNLNTLRIGKNNITNFGAVSMAKIAKSSNGLRNLDMGSPNVNDDGLFSVIDILNDIDRKFTVCTGGSNITKEGYRNAYIVTKLSNLTVDLGNFSFSDYHTWPTGNCAFYDCYLAHNSTASNILIDTPCDSNSSWWGQQASLRGDMVSGSMISIAPALQQMTQLRVLNMYYNDYNNNFGDDAGVLLAQVLKHLTLLEDFSIGRASMGNEGAIAIASAVQSFANLETLSFYSTINNTGAIAIATIAKSMNLLRKLGLGSNNIDNSGLVAAVNILKNSTTPLTIAACGPNITYDGPAFILAQGTNITISYSSDC